MEPITRLDGQMTKHADRIEQLIDRFGLPLHLVFHDEIEANANAFLQAIAPCGPDGVVAFAAKSNPCRGALRAASGLGLGADTASEHELRAALEEGIPPERIVCNGNAKSLAYLQSAVDAGAWIAVDNVNELDMLDELPAASRAGADVLVRFRGMPLAGLTSDDQTTAADWTKFGFHLDEADALFARLVDDERLRFRGVSAHIGTQIANPRGYERLIDHLLDLIDRARAAGLSPDTIDLGGGFPVAFLTEQAWTDFTDRLLAAVRGHGAPSDAVTWNRIPMGFDHLRRGDDGAGWIGKAYWSSHPAARMLDHLLHYREAEGGSVLERLSAAGVSRLIVEPGRSLMATSGVTITEVMGTKRVLGHLVVALDMGINNHGTNLISPDIFPAAVLPRRPGDAPTEAFLAGRLCFSGDMISKAKVPLNRAPKRGERFVIYHTGAYGADHFASNSCGFPRPAKAAIRADGTAELWRRPESFDDVFGSAGDRLTID